MFKKLKRKFKRRNKKSKTNTYLNVRRTSSRADFEFLNFNIRLVGTVKKVVVRKFYFEFFYRVTLIWLYNNSILDKQDLLNEKIAGIFIEGFRKGYFKKLYNILLIKYSNPLYDYGITFGDFLKNFKFSSYSLLKD